MLNIPSISVTLISRLMLNLHKAVKTGIFSTQAWPSSPTLSTFFSYRWWVVLEINLPT
ncbi:hypothetical protein BDR04DRAFT_768735 [Suillus decipiens]|nr:hypothetical protein BDR04DRAFT_768735 [Suillus decipiens]